MSPQPAQIPMEQADLDLQARLGTLGDALDAAASYVRRYKPIKLPTIRQLRREADYALRASQRRQCVGLYGPSQAGKSFLIGELGRGGEDDLRVSPSGRSEEAVSFLDHINPNKGNEATGVVCRFTTCPQETPERPDTFVARLISQADLIKCLATGFIYECEFLDTEGLAERIDAVFKELPAGEGEDAFVKVLDDAWAYVEKHFPRHPYYAPFLSRGDQERHIRRRLSRVGRLAPSQRAALAAMLWGAGQLPAIDALYRHLSQALANLGDAEYVEIERAAIVAKKAPTRRDEPASLVHDSEILIDLMKGARGDCQVFYGAGAQQSMQIEKATASALIAELYFPAVQAESDESILAHADILDFPGARAGKAGGGSGVGAADLQTTADGNEALVEVLKRGKLTYLFDGYCAEREISVLVFCVDTTENFECHQAPKQVDRWIRTRYPRFDHLNEDELELPSLFLCLTKFDRRVMKTKGVGVEERWATAIEKVLSIFGGRAAAGPSLSDTAMMTSPDSPELDAPRPHKLPWITNWGAQGERPFDNIYWVRNPDFPEHGIDLDVLAEYRRQYEQCELIVKHIRDHRRRWEAAAPQNPDTRDTEHTGIALVNQMVVKKLRPEIKRAELADQLHVLVKQLVAALPRYEAAGQDEVEKQKQAREDARQMIDLIRRHETNCVFGPLLAALNLPAEIIHAELDAMTVGVAPVSGEKVIEEFIDTVTARWLEQVEAALADEAGVEIIMRENADALDRFAEQIAIRARSPEFRAEFRSAIKFFFESALGLETFRQPLTAVCCRKWSDLVAGLGFGLERDGAPELPPRLSGAVPWQRYMNHWDNHMEELYAQNCAVAADVPEGNEELGAILKTIEPLQTA